MQRKTKTRSGLHRRAGSPYWYASYTDAHERRIKRSTGTDSKVEAEALLAKWRADVHQEAKWGREPERTLHQLIIAYIDDHADKASLDRDAVAVAHLYRLLGENRRLNNLTPGDMHHYVATRKREGVGPACINREIGLMSSALNWARHHLGWDVPNPAQRQRLPEPPGRDRWLTREEAARLVSAAQELRRAPHLADIIVLGLHTGLRPGEMLGLEWARVDLARSCLWLRAGIDQKNRKADQIPLNGQARAALLSRARFRAAHCPAARWVFCTKSGRRMESIKISFGNACKRAGIEDCHPHDLRRTCATWLVSAGVSIHDVSKLLRHSDIRVTDRVYAHLSPARLAEAVAVLDRPNSVPLQKRDDPKNAAST